LERSNTIELIVALADPLNRAAAAREVAVRLGVEELLLLVRDPDLGTFIPAPGFAQTLRSGRSWRAFLSCCSHTQQHAGEVELPEGCQRAAVAFMHGATVAVLLGGHLLEAESRMLRTVLPLLAAVLQSEQEAVLARAQAEDATDTVNRVQTLAAALENARADAARLISELRAQDRHKDEFLAMLGHELRNPLSALGSATELLRRGSNAGIESRPLQIMGRQIVQLTRLVNDLLDVSRVSRGRIELELEPLGLEEVLREALEESLPLLGEREHSATIEIAQPLTVRGDRVRLTQIFGNLINNAAKYTPPHGTVKLSASQDGDYAVVQVQDNGIGIASDMLAKIFDLFVQVQTSIDKARGGLGIGLTLVRTLVELHGGRIEAASEGTGRGTTMKLWLPLARPLESGARSSAAGRLNRRNSHVLVVDDNEDAADCIAELLRVMGPTVQVAYDARQALEFGRQHQFDLILLDIGLPGMDGYEVARRLRSEKRQCAAQIVALTGFGADRLQAPCFDDWLIKPISIEALQDLLDRV